MRPHLVALVATLLVAAGCIDDASNETDADDAAGPSTADPGFHVELGTCSIGVLLAEVDRVALGALLPDGWTVLPWGFAGDVADQGLLEIYTQACDAASFAMVAVAVNPPDSDEFGYYSVHMWTDSEPIANALSERGWTSETAASTAALTPLISGTVDGVLDFAGAAAPPEPAPPGSLPYWRETDHGIVQWTDAWDEPLGFGFGPTTSCSFDAAFPGADLFPPECAGGTAGFVGPGLMSVTISVR